MRLSSSVIGSVAVLGLGCESSTEPLRELRLEIEPDRAEWVVGESVGATVRVINLTDEPVTLTGNTCFVTLTIVDDDGRNRTPLMACRDIGREYPLAGHGTLELEVEWDGRLIEPASLLTRPAEPGVYYLRGELNASQGHRSTPAVPVLLRTSAPQ